MQKHALRDRGIWVACLGHLGTIVKPCLNNFGTMLTHLDAIWIPWGVHRFPPHMILERVWLGADLPAWGSRGSAPPAEFNGPCPKPCTWLRSMEESSIFWGRIRAILRFCMSPSSAHMIVQGHRWSSPPIGGVWVGSAPPAERNSVLLHNHF